MEKQLTPRQVAYRAVNDGRTYAQAAAMSNLTRSQVARIMYRERHPRQKDPRALLRAGTRWNEANQTMLKKDATALTPSAALTIPDKTVEDRWYKGRKYNDAAP